MPAVRQFWISKAPNGLWLLEQHDGLDQFATEEAALAMAKERARLAFAGWKDAQVHVRGSDDEWRTVLLIGETPSRFPPG